MFSMYIFSLIRNKNIYIVIILNAIFEFLHAIKLKFLFFVISKFSESKSFVVVK